MKNVFYFLGFCFFLISCSKKQEGDSTGLIGKWKAVEQFQSPGYGGQYVALPLSEQFIIEFKSDSSFAYSVNFPKASAQFISYSVNGNQISMIPTSVNMIDYWTSLSGNPIESELILSIFSCREGCPYKFLRQ